jgi:precorrin-2 dehydrogenase/sirohydrochlorin ferrochelatase
VRYYPLFLDISRRRCLIVGGGQVAERKADRLLACGAAVEVVSRRLTARLAALREAGRIVHHDAGYRESFLAGVFLVIGATDDEAVNERVSRDARDRGILVNIVDDPERCDFILPAVLERGDLAIAVATGGRSPALAREIRLALEANYGPEYAVLTEILGRVREAVLAEGGASAANRERFEALLDSDILDLIRARRREEIRALIARTTGVNIEVGRW